MGERAIASLYRFRYILATAGAGRWKIPPEPAKTLVRRGLAREHGWTITDLVRLSLSLLKIAYEAASEDNRLAVVDKRGRVVKEILLPT